MDSLIFQNNLDQARKTCLVLGGVSLTLLIANLLLVLMCFFFAHRQSTVVIPMGLKNPVAISSYDVSSEYLADMANSFVSLRLDFSPKTVDANHQILENYLASGSFADITKTLNAEALEVKNQEISSSFYVTGIQVDTRALVATVTGTLNRSVGQEHLAPANVTFLLKFENEHGILKIINFSEYKPESK